MSRMNNSQFSRLLTEANASDGSKASTSSRPVLATPNSMRTSQTFVPRRVNAQSDGYSLAKRDFSDRGEPQRKRSKLNVPKGTRLPGQYVDRAKERAAQQERRSDDDGSDVPVSRPPKGLDRNLLERNRRGDDTLQALQNDSQRRALRRPGSAGGERAEERLERPEGLDAELEDIEDRIDMSSTARSRRRNMLRGQIDGEPDSKAVAMSNPRSRAEILAEFRRSRALAKEPAKSISSGKFRAIGRGRQQPVPSDGPAAMKTNVDRSAPREPLSQLNEDVAALAEANLAAFKAARRAAENTRTLDVDIFAGVGDYQPFEFSDSDTEIVEKSVSGQSLKMEASNEEGQGYFQDESLASGLNLEARFGVKPLSQQKAVGGVDAPSPRSDVSGAPEEPLPPVREEDVAAEERRQALLRRLQGDAFDRDAADMDMDFGGSFTHDLADDADDGRKVKLSHWTGGRADDGQSNGPKSEQRERKLGQKKGKAVVSSATNVLQVMNHKKSLR